MTIIKDKVNEMVEIHAEPISATFHIGNEITLTPSWRDKNVILPNSKLFYILDGEIVIETQNGTVTATGGDMVLIPAGTKHDFHLSRLNYAKKCWLHFDMSAGGKEFFANYVFPYKIHVGKNDFVKKAFDDIFKKCKSAAPEDRLSVTSNLTALICFYLEKAGYSEKTVTLKDEIDRAILYIGKNYGENLSLTEIAKSANLSPNYFVRKFKERTGYAPLKYVNVMKMERAKYLIEQSDDSIGAIMEELGFYDASHFSKLFKKYCGYSPQKFRELSVNRTVK